MARTDAVLGERIARNGLAAPRCATVAEAAAITTAVQAQDNQASRFGIRVRAPVLAEADVLAAITEQRSVVRTWLLRGTIHLVDTADLRWLVALIGPVVIRKYRTRWRQLGLHDDVLERSLTVLPDVLAGRALTRHEIHDALRERGVAPEASDPQAPTHAILHACCTGLACRGADRGRDATFVLTDEWVPRGAQGPRGDDALAELARRYFTAFAPATAGDFAVWSGLPGTKAVRLIRDELTEVDVYGRPGYRLGTVPPERSTRLLPAFDNYLLGYRDRSAILGAPDYGRVYIGGLIRPTVLVDGQVVGVWALNRVKRTVTMTPFEALTHTARRGINREVAALGRFTGLDLAVVIDGG
ncbi:winged helix DNA-binding domain-containing protein [uncultured Jatrophihabitans sp.]|uniref:winged helix DNA-binding domain-containing protein n=1 Tax=uncultured Jatrophihabitans sp. TaxID=1610747 RepID=UPI0035C9CD90